MKFSSFFQDDHITLLETIQVKKNCLGSECIVEHSFRPHIYFIEGNSTENVLFVNQKGFAYRVSFLGGKNLRTQHKISCLHPILMRYAKLELAFCPAFQLHAEIRL